jgi:hypothetical protein
MKKDLDKKTIKKLKKTKSTSSTSTKSSAKNVFASDLLTLQNKIKRDPTSYKDEVF